MSCSIATLVTAHAGNHSKGARFSGSGPSGRGCTTYLQNQPSKIRDRYCGYGALREGHRRQSIFHHALTSAASRRRIHDLGQVVEGMDVVNRIARGDRMERIEIIEAK